MSESARATTAATFYELQALLAEWAHLIDHRGGDGVEDLFCEDGSLEFLAGRARGREAIRETYARRRSRGTRTARHLNQNLSVKHLDHDRARVFSIMVVYADDGTPPLPASVPLLVQDVVDECVLEPDGVWRFASRRFIPIFQAEREVALPLPPVADTPPPISPRQGSSQ